MNEGLSHILFLDIETVSGVEDYSALDDRLKGPWVRKASLIQRIDESDEELYYQRAGIYAEFGKIVCVAVGKMDLTSSPHPILRTKYFVSHHEKTILEEVKDLMDRKGKKDMLLCAHNGKEFDFPYLARRMLINGISLPEMLSFQGKKPWQIPHLDTMELWKFGDYKHYTSLDLMTAIFGIPTSKNEMDGSQVNEVYYKEKNLEKIAQYCVRDVVAVAQLYLKLKNLPLITEENIKPSA